MAELEDLERGAAVKGVIPDSLVTIVDLKWHGGAAVELTYKDQNGKLGSQLLYRDNEPDLQIVSKGKPWSFDADGYLFRLVLEAYRIRLAYLFDPVLAVHTSLVAPLPHQITAVYGQMLHRQPLRYLLADDPGAGKTIMAGLLIKELLIRGDLRNCLVVCPGNLVEQWQDELYSKFHLPFEILTNDKLESARTGNWFYENPLAVCRLDKLSRNEDVQIKLDQVDWDLVVVDEAHKMSASFYGGEIKETKRYKLGKLLSRNARHFLLLTATPHNGKEEDFQLFLALLDGDRFEGKFRDGVHASDVSDLMRRLVKERLLKFDGRPLFPERIAYTVDYKLSDLEAVLYKEVTEYVKEEFNRADSLENDGRKGTVGFALTILQRRLASSPEAIYRSLVRRRERLEKRVREEELLRRGAKAEFDLMEDLPSLTEEEVEEFEDESPEAELADAEEKIVDQATAAHTIAELKTEIEILKNLENLALKVRNSRTDRKWEELSKLLQNNPEMYDAQGHRRKLVIFTEHRDTLYYLADRIRGLLGRQEAVVTIHGGMGREERSKAKELFLQDKDVEILVATDAAGEGINLQRAHLMVNYDLPWNPNRLEQRFGRIHRIGQTEVCHLWNLTASETREGEVYHQLLRKLEEQKTVFGGQVFDILGKIRFDNKSLRDLLIEAVRYGEMPEVKERLNKIVNQTMDRQHLQDLIEEHALTHDSMDVSEVRKIREEMERAEARRLQPHFIGSFFIEAFKHLGGTIRERESSRFEITHTPGSIRNRDRMIGNREPILSKYERITFEKNLISVSGKSIAEFICPGHPLLDAALDLILEQHRKLLKQGAVLVDPEEETKEVRMLFCLEHGIQDARADTHGNRRLVSRRLQFVEITKGGEVRMAGYAPHLDYRPLLQEEKPLAEPLLEEEWIQKELEERALSYAISNLVPEHYQEVSKWKEALLVKTMQAVKERLTKEINYWDHRSQELKLQEQAGKINARLNSENAQRRADELAARLQKRMAELEQERKLSPLPPLVVGGALVVTEGMLKQLRVSGQSGEFPTLFAREKKQIERAAVEAVIERERSLGFEPLDVSREKRGYDIESRIPGTGKLRFIEVKGRISGAETVTVSKNEILTCLNKPDEFILAVVEVEGENRQVHYLEHPFHKELDFAVTSVNYNIEKLLDYAERVEDGN